MAYVPEELDKTLAIFFAEVRKSDGTEYEPDCLRVLLSGLDRYLKDSEAKFSIARDREFLKCRQVLEGKARSLREQGYGKRPNAAKPLTAEDEEKLWNSGVLGEHNPRALISTLWYLLTLHFGLRGCQEHHSMQVEDFTTSKDDQGLEYLTFEESLTKTRQGGLRKKRRVVQPKMFATGGPRCPVRIFRSFLVHRPEDLRYKGPFYLAVIENPTSVIWYKAQRMGVNTINTFMKRMSAEGNLDLQGRKLTNHTARKTLVKKLKASNQPRSAIIGVTGHTSERSLADYEEGDENEQRQISSIISGINAVQPSVEAAPRQPLATRSFEPGNQMITVNHFHGCQVTINYQSDGSSSLQQQLTQSSETSS